MPGKIKSQSRTAGARVYSMRDLNQRTAEIMREIVEDDEPGLITRRGRIIAVIMPLTSESVEGAAISAALGEGRQRAEALGRVKNPKVTTTEAAAAALGVNLPDYRAKRH